MKKFPAPFFTGTETKAVIQVDYRVGSVNTGAHFALAGGGTGIPDGNQQMLYSPQLAIQTTASGLKFRLIPKATSGTIPGTPGNWASLEYNETIPFSTSSPGAAGVAIGEWIQLILVMDLRNDGLGSVFYRNLTRNVPDKGLNAIQNKPLGLRGVSSDPSLWDYVWTRVNSPSPAPATSMFVDNLLVVANGPGSQNFEGPLSKRSFSVWDEKAPSGQNSKTIEFPDFVALSSRATPQGNHFVTTKIPVNIRDLASILPDPKNALNKALRMTCLYNDASDPHGRNELHYGLPYAVENQNNGVPYQFAFRFYIPEPPAQRVILMQGFSEFPWLRIDAHPNGLLMLDLAKSSGTVTMDVNYKKWLKAYPGAAKPTSEGPTTPQHITAWQTWMTQNQNWLSLVNPVAPSNTGTPPPTQIGPNLDGEWWDSENPSLGTYYKEGWNTVVVRVVHSNLPSTHANTGKIEIFINGNKMATYTGRTTFFTDSNKIPFMKAGPYGSVPNAAVWYDDVSWKADHAYPSEFAHPGFFNGGIYELEPLCAPGKRADMNTGTLNVTSWGKSTGSGDNQQWIAQSVGGGLFELRSLSDPNRRLRVDRNNSRVVTYVASPNESRWKVTWNTGGYFEIAPGDIPTQRLEVQGGSTTQGAQVKVATSNNSIAQRWRIIRRN